MGEQERNFVLQAFDSNWIAPLGPHVNEFENDLAQYNGVNHAIALSSGTAAIHIALVMENLQPGDAVFCQSFTFCGSANPIVYEGATPVFIDSEKDTWNMDSEKLEEAIEDCLNGKLNLRPRAIVPVNLYGMPARLQRIREIGDRYGLTIIEDAAESLGASYFGRKTGTFGHLGVYSFNGNKIITTSGGGALVSEDHDRLDRALHLATQARDDAPHYQHTDIGYNYRMSNILAGIGRGQMRLLDQRVKQRRANFQRYRQFFEDWNARGFEIKFQEEPADSYSNRWLTTIIIDPDHNAGLSNDTLRLALQDENIESRPLWKPMHQQPVFAEFPFYATGVSDYLFANGLCLPSGTQLQDHDFERILETINRVMETYTVNDQSQLAR